jgi:asparaginyl-tRNA synthetase
MADHIYKPKHTTLKTIFRDPLSLVDQTHTVKGWIKQNRSQVDLMFIKLKDGTCAGDLQLIFNKEATKTIQQDGVDVQVSLKEYIEKDAYVGSTLFATGTIIKSPAKGQPIEMVVTDATVFGKITEPLKYMPGMKGVPIDTMRETPHLRFKCDKMDSIFRIRSALMGIVRDFFKDHDAHHLDPNVVTASDCEGAGETFTLTNMLSDGDVTKVPVVKEKSEEDETQTTQIDFSKDFFGKQVGLTVSSQLQLEAICAGMGSVYTMNPSFRAEKSKTKRHLACFTHLEWELPFIELSDLMDFSEELVTYCFKSVLEQCDGDLKELDKSFSKGIIDKLKWFITDRFARITYDEAIDLVWTHKKKIQKKFKELKDIPKWGDDLGSYCERYISEEIYKKPTFVYNYPRELKSFYMKQNAPYEVTLYDGSKQTRHTVQGCDLLIPGLGELIGSSIREENYQTLLTEMERRKMAVGPLQWYVDLRKDASTPTGGAGLGFDRLVSVCALMDGNIRDVTPFPVAYQECKY